MKKRMFIAMSILIMLIAVIIVSSDVLRLPPIKYENGDCKLVYYNTTEYLFKIEEVTYENGSTNKVHTKIPYIVQHNRTDCVYDGKVRMNGQIIGYDNAYCKFHEDLSEIHCDLTRDRKGGKGDSNGDGTCQSGEDDCEIIKVTNRLMKISFKKTKESWRPTKGLTPTIISK